MRKTNLGIVIKDEKILLCMKKRGFGAGLWNSAGGKLDDCESMEECMIRELKEETNLEAKKLEMAGILYFHFPDNPDWNNECHVFRINDFAGVAEETEEMKPEWYNLDEIPYDKMWKDDPIWLPRIIAGEYIEYELYFDKDGGVAKYVKIK
ncbi:NUDIX domain-containing protein [Candidatus Gracilibacteria bacterium]|nr:NUDIX domain-containing protein [Candidatus Gracilibacteria bacterium]